MSVNIDSYQEYRRRIEMMADGIEDEYDEYYDELTEAVFETVDSSREVIYTHESLNVLKYAETKPGEWKHLVAEDDSWHQIITALAFSIVRQDLWDELHDRGVEQ